METVTVHENGLITYYFNVLRLMLEYVLGEKSFCSVI